MFLFLLNYRGGDFSHKIQFFSVNKSSTIGNCIVSFHDFVIMIVLNNNVIYLLFNVSSGEILFLRSRADVGVSACVSDFGRYGQKLHRRRSFMRLPLHTILGIIECFSEYRPNSFLMSSIFLLLAIRSALTNSIE